MNHISEIQRSCAQCGRIIPRADARFCGKCGTKLSEVSNGFVSHPAVPPARGSDPIGPVQNILPTLQPHQKLDVSAARYPSENTFLAVIVGLNVIILIGIPSIFLALRLWYVLLFIALGIGFLAALNRFAFALMYWFIYGNSILVSAAQYPQLHRAIETTCDYIDLSPRPECFVLHGEGLFELFLIKRFTKRGILIFTSELVDKLLDDGDSRQLMMLIGRQLGHIKAGHYRWYFAKHVLGRFAFLFYQAWRRRSHYTADRVGFLVTANLEVARRALLTITVGKVLSDATSIDAVREQDAQVTTRLMARLRALFSEYPYMVRRIIELEAFRDHVRELPVNVNAKQVVAALPTQSAVFKFEHVVVQGSAVFGDRTYVH